MRQPAQELGPRATRTVALILEAAKGILLTHGYAGTTVDEIARVAGISRASFYTYFPSKRDVLLALGVDSAHAGMHMIDLAAELTTPVSIGPLEKYVKDCFAVLDDHASFAFAWTQAAEHDEEIRVAGMRRHLQLCGQLGQVLGQLRGRPFDHPAAQGLALFSELERAWSYCRLYSDPVLEEAVHGAIASGLHAVIGGRRLRAVSRSSRSGT